MSTPHGYSEQKHSPDSILGENLMLSKVESAVAARDDKLPKI